ncbi:MAG: hypothetical protein QM703_16570 [Gemmatales bacterium]
MKTLADRFRRWYDHERDSNAKCIAMLESVPAERRVGSFLPESGGQDGPPGDSQAAMAVSIGDCEGVASDLPEGDFTQ